MITAVAALVRAPSPRIAEAELTHLERTPIDVALVARQHADYLAVLSGLGLELVHAPPLPDHADGVFVEDAVVVAGDRAVLTRPGAPSRRGEVDSLAGVLGDRGLDVHRIRAPGTLDGGDVLQVGSAVYVGRTARTDDAGIEQLRALLAPLGRRVVRVPVTGVLHLKTAVTALPDGSLVAVPGHVDPTLLADHDVLWTAEPAGGDVLVVNGTVLLSAAAPGTAAAVAARGFDVEVVDVSELEKAEAGVTCLSVLLPPV